MIGFLFVLFCFLFFLTGARSSEIVSDDLREPGPSGGAGALVGAGLSGRAGNHTAVGLHVFTHKLIGIFKYI